MNVREYIRKHRLIGTGLDRAATPFERGDFPHYDVPVYSSSYLDAVGTRRATVVYPTTATQKVATIVRQRDVKPSEIYRDVLEKYLADT